MRTSTFHISKKAAVVVAAGALTVTAAGGAYAYWTTTGSGTGSAANAGSNGTVVLHASFADGLTPGASESVSFTGDNAGTSSLYVGTIHLASVSVDSAHSNCKATDFSMPDVVSNTIVPANTSGQALTNTGTVTFADTAVNQDGCKGATITLNLSSN